MLYTFRIDRTQRAAIIERLRVDRTLSQGWGGGTDRNLDIRTQGFRDAVREYYDLATTRIPSNLLRIRDFVDGDILVTPHVPEDGKASIHIVDGDFPDCYEYSREDATHLNHRIRIKRSYGLDGQISASNDHMTAWKAKLPWMRLPVYPAGQFESSFVTIIDLLNSEPDRQLRTSDLDSFLMRVAGDVLRHIDDELQSIAPSGGAISFERVCERLLQRSGFRIRARNKYDRLGGDADLECVRDRQETSPFESGETRLYVQIKKHTGVTDDEAVRQLLKIMEHDQSADGCVMSLAKNFTEAAQQLAEDNGITLLNGPRICGLMLAELATEWVG